ncbi:MAG: WG repeat-containing protein [Rubrivivax sp.]|nr:WG repeat-containing protein [Rubrivivax sp.]
MSKIRLLGTVLILGHIGFAMAGADRLSPFEDPVTGLWGYRSEDNVTRIPPQFHVAEEFLPSGIAAAADQSGWVYLDRRGNRIIRPFLYDNGPDPFAEGLARFVDGGQFGFFDERGGIAIPARFDFVEPFSAGLAAFCTGCRRKWEGEHQRYEGGRWGYIDREGKTVIAPRFDAARSFTGAFAEVRIGEAWIRIDRKGEPVP